MGSLLFVAIPFLLFAFVYEVRLYRSSDSSLLLFLSSKRDIEYHADDGALIETSDVPDFAATLHHRKNILWNFIALLEHREIRIVEIPS